MARRPGLFHRMMTHGGKKLTEKKGPRPQPTFMSPHPWLTLKDAALGTIVECPTCGIWSLSKDPNQPVCDNRDCR